MIHDIITLTVQFADKQTKNEWISPTLANHMLIAGGYGISDDGYQGFVDLVDPSEEVCRYFILMLKAGMIKGFMFGKVNL